MTAEESDRDGKADTEASQQGRSAGDHNTGPNSDSECKVQDHAPFSSPRPDTSAASRPSPLLRANPYSEVMDPICRLPLLTLIYRLKALYLRDLLRIWVRRDTSTWLSPGFLRSEGKIRTPPQLRCFSRSKSYLPARGFQAIRTLIQKRKFFLDHFGLSQWILLWGPEWYMVPLSDFGIEIGFPFAQWVCFWSHISIFICLYVWS